MITLWPGTKRPSSSALLIIRCFAQCAIKSVGGTYLKESLRTYLCYSVFDGSTNREELGLRH